MKSIFSRQGIPKLVISDNGPQFNCRHFGKFVSEYGFTHVASSPRYAQSNGLVESTIQTVKNTLKKSLLDGTDPYLALLMLRIYQAKFLVQPRSYIQDDSGIYYLQQARC
ncbi:hypothetical protein Trydic_g1693 [Trypoxylus dichotomus]